MREARAALAVVLPGAARGPATGAQAPGALGQGLLYESLLALLGRLARTRAPILVALEDLHWADRSTLRCVAFLARNLRAEALAVT